MKQEFRRNAGGEETALTKKTPPKGGVFVLLVEGRKLGTEQAVDDLI
jgi:hypothetical protein